MTTFDQNALFQAACAARTHAYAPYSGFRVGAALLCEDGRIFTGCNVENASYGAALCAERNALCAAVADGKREFIALAVVCSGEDYAFPCGICRQVIGELAPQAVIILENSKGELREYNIEALLPQRFYLKK